MITCGIATLKQREGTFKRTIESLYPQVDRIIVALNLYDEVPEWLRIMRNVECVICDNSLGDAYKFLKVAECKGYYFSCDDDIYYPKTYIMDTIAKIDSYSCIITYHGKRYDGVKPVSSYQKGFSTNIHCLRTLIMDTEVHVGGSGVMSFNTEDFKLSIDGFIYPNMADVFVAKAAHKQGVKIISLAHKNNYFRYMKPEGETIWHKHFRDPRPTEVLNSFLK